MMKTVLLGSPEFYRVEEGDMNLEKVKEQHNRLKAHLESHGIRVKVVPGSPTLYDSVYITNSALIINDFAIMARFAKPTRRGEELLTAEYLKKMGIRCRWLPEEDGLYFEGQGDCKLTHCGAHLWMGYGVGRTTRKGIAAVNKILEEELGPKAPTVHALRILDKKTFHLDLCFLPLPNGRALYHATLAPQALKEIAKIFGARQLIKMPMKFFYGCNSVVIDEKHLLVPRIDPDYRHWIYKASDMKLDEVNVNQFQIGNGSVQCITLNMFEI